MPLNQVHGNSYGDVEVYYHRQTPVDGEWWMRLPQNEREQIFAEGHTPRVVPVGKLDWEIEAPRSAYWAGLERRTSGSQGRNE